MWVCGCGCGVVWGLCVWEEGGGCVCEGERSPTQKREGKAAPRKRRGKNRNTTQRRRPSSTTQQKRAQKQPHPKEEKEGSKHHPKKEEAQQQHTLIFPGKGQGRLDRLCNILNLFQSSVSIFSSFLFVPPPLLTSPLHPSSPHAHSTSHPFHHHSL